MDWKSNGKNIETTTSTTGKGTLKVLGVECAVVESGKVLLGGGEVTSVSCPGVAQCEGSSEVEAVGLPWKTELVDVPVKNGGGEVERYEVRERFYGASGKEPGWDLVCKGKPVLSCSGEVSGNLENISSGVVVEFDSSSPRMSCGGGPGSLVGSIVFGTGVEGSVLSATGAPKGPQLPVVVSGEAKEVVNSTAKLTGTVAARGVATTYRFEYGPTKGYGTSVPVPSASAGEGRLPVEVSQSVTGLEEGTLYYFRLVASNSSGASYGEAKTFTPGYPSYWEVNGKIATPSVTGKGTLKVLGVECAVVESGKVLLGGGEVTSVSCPGVAQCEGSSEVEAVGLPWKTELVDVPVKNGGGEVERYEVRERFYGASGKEPGWDLVCKGKPVLSCSGEVSGNLENISSGVVVEFDSSSPRMSCGGGPGSLVGSIVFGTGVEGSVLSATGAPKGPQIPVAATGEAKEVTSSSAKLTGTIATRGAATTYHFEYGPTKKLRYQRSRTERQRWGKSVADRSFAEHKRTPTTHALSLSTCCD